MKNLPVSKIMTRPLVTVAADDSLYTVKKLLEERGLHHVLVVEGGRMVGILSSADLLKLALLLQPGEERNSTEVANALGIKVRDLMQTRIAVVRESATLKDAADALQLGGFHALPVLAFDDTPVGIVTSTDLIGLLMDRIERDGTSAVPADPPSPELHAHENPHLLEVLRAAEIYLRSGQSDQQHARLTRAVERAREISRASNTVS